MSTETRRFGALACLILAQLQQATAAFAVVPPMLAYGAMKSALWTMTRYLARECAPAVRVNAICPGTIQEGGELKVPT